MQILYTHGTRIRKRKSPVQVLQLTGSYRLDVLQQEKRGTVRMKTNQNIVSKKIPNVHEYGLSADWLNIKFTRN